MTCKAQVLIIDDDAQLRDSMTVLLATANIGAVGFATAEEFLVSGLAERPACVLLDVRLPGMSGIELLDHFDEMGVRHIVVMVTGHGDIPDVTGVMACIPRFKLSVAHVSFQ